MKNAELLTKRFEKNIAGVLNCFDRLVLFGTYQPICYPQAMSWQLHEAGIQLIDYENKFANKLRLEMTARIKAIAAKENIAIKQVYASVRKEALVSEILSTRGDAPGIVCILSAMESCRCFKVRKNHKSGYLELQWKPGKCLHYYVYLMDPDYGLCYLRIPTWAPFRLQFYFNGHDWLQRRMAAAGITYRKADNCFVHVSDFQRAQSIVDSFDVNCLHRRLDQLAARFVAVHGRWGQGLHWSIYQAEWATDVVFKSSRILPVLYEELVRTAAIEIKCADIYSFYSLGAVAEQMQACNRRYLSFISQWRDHSGERTDLRKITSSVKDDKQRSYRGVNFFQSDDMSFMLAILRGEYQIAGFTNRALQSHLAEWNSQKIGRVLKRFRVLRLIRVSGAPTSTIFHRWEKKYL